MYNNEENQALNIRHDVSGVSPVNRDMFLVLLGFFYIKTNNNINTTVSCFSRV